MPSAATTTTTTTTTTSAGSAARKGASLSALAAVAVALVALCPGPVAVGVRAEPPAAWRNRTIYQLLTDRFGNVQSAAPCADLNDYCGGSFAGIDAHLDYIQGMGFDAIWISPVPKNTPGGYHGYWAEDLATISPPFGGATQLRSMVLQAQERGIWVMLDVVGNHMGPVCSSPSNCSFGTLNPFNEGKYFHSCSPCPSNCQIHDFSNAEQTRLCRLSGLPDLNQSVPYVEQQLTSWVKQTVQRFGINGLRIDTVPEVNLDFWKTFVASAGVYAVGEVFNGDVSYVSGFQQPKGPLPGVLSYPLFFTFRHVFAQKQSMNQLQTLTKSYASDMGDVSLLGTFVDNHDNPRFLSENSDKVAYQNALAYALFSTGIPIIYYGTEQGFDGGAPPASREVLWTSNYATTGELYVALKNLIAQRKALAVWNEKQIQRYATDDFYAFTRGNTFVALTNVGKDGPDVSYPISYQPYADGTVICNVFDNTDCLTVTSGSFTVKLTGGMFKIYTPSTGRS